MSELISSGQDQSLALVAEWLVKTNKGLGYMYIGNESEKIALILFSCEELKELLSL